MNNGTLLKAGFNPDRSPIRIILTGVLLACLLPACRAGPAGLSRPTGVAVAGDGSLYVMDHADSRHSRVVHISAAGKILATFKPDDPQPGLVYAGWDMAVGPTGNVYYCHLVSNDDRTVHDGLLAFSPQGKFLYEFGAADYPVDSSQLSAVPYNLDVDDRGWVYAADFNYNRLRVFDAQGQLRAAFTAENTAGFDFLGLGDVVLDDRRNLLYLADFFAARLSQYQLSIQPDGSLTLRHNFTLGAFGHGQGEFSFPQYLAVDEVTGTVYVGDMGNRRIVAFDPQGSYLTAFSPPSDEWQVLGLAVGPDSGQPGRQALFAADALNRVIWVFGLDGQFQRKVEVH